MKKRLAGLKGIHVATYNIDNGTFGTPVPITGAKSVSAELEYSEVKFYADDVNDFADYQFSGGSGELVLSGLQLEEYKTLFGCDFENGVATINSGDTMPQLALLFERKKLGTQDKVLYVLYNVKFAPPAIEANTLEGDISEETITLPFTVSEMPNGDVYRMADTGATSVAQGVVETWYEKVFTGVVPTRQVKTVKTVKVEEKEVA
ncbi:MAG: major tail protein [Terrisporobacter othiniensis]|uniref:major tail protein n=1 Tax=Terrisporobacter othiniensis TaxID=1577792 RepID=UPI002A766695|nr:major tail protein [Terrisporobacter othiniensis]MDY3372063.1 major tail protein [Terrisporobacter othiniensis]